MYNRSGYESFSDVTGVSCTVVLYSVVAAPVDQLSPDGRKRILNIVNESKHSTDGYEVGIAEGNAVDGSGLGPLDGVEVGRPLGNDVDGSGDGSGVGHPVGFAVGAADGACDGAAVGNSDGVGVGLILGLELGPPKRGANSSQILDGIDIPVGDVVGAGSGSELGAGNGSMVGTPTSKRSVEDRMVYVTDPKVAVLALHSVTAQAWSLVFPKALALLGTSSMVNR